MAVYADVLARWNILGREITVFAFLEGNFEIAR